MRQNSFFGGPAGESFTITHHFNNKKEMSADLDNQWSSVLHPGDYVCISYGLPSDTDTYTLNRDIDLFTYGETYNGTLWQKTYSDATTILANTSNGILGFYNGASFGLGYNLITSMAGATPVVKFLSETIGATETPYIVTDTSSADNPVIKFYLPKADTLTMQIVSTVDLNESSGIADSLATVSAHLSSLGYSLDRDELVAVNYTNSKKETASYWYYQTDGTWYRSYLGEGDAGIIYWDSF